MIKKRAVILYRMSTDRQDLDTQKKMNRKFCKEMDFEIVDEFFEDGVSGYKNSINMRPDLLSILDKAEKREFDVLVVYIFDRIVRREEEYPLILNHFWRHKVEVYSSSTREKVKNREHTDKLTNYITGWQNEYESIKTSVRVKDAIKNRNESGEFMGGSAPFGYEIYTTSNTNHRGKVMRDLRINEREAEIVKMIFDMYNNKNYGTTLISQTLNKMGYTSRKGGKLRQDLVGRILKNSTCIGRRPYNKFKSTRDEVIPLKKDEWKMQPYREELRIIEDEEFYKAVEKITNRGESGAKRLPRNSRQLFSGMVYCGYCKNKLNSNYNVKVVANKTGGTRKDLNNRFFCKFWTEGRTDIPHPQKTYGGKKYQETALKIVYKFMKNIDKDKLIGQINQHKSEGVDSLKLEIKQLEKTCSEIVRLIQKLEVQIDDAILNDDNKKVDILTRRIEKNEEDIIRNRERIRELEAQVNQNVVENKQLINTYESLDNWIEKFEEGEMGAKKTMLMEVVDKVYFSKDKVEVVLKLQLSQSFASNPFEPNNEGNDSGNNPCLLLGEPHGITSQKHDYVYITLSEKIA